MAAGSVSHEYDFAGYLEALGEDWLADDALLQRWLQRSQPDMEGYALVERFGRDVALRYRCLAEEVERFEKHPRLRARGPFNDEPQGVALPAETLEMQGAVHGSRLWRGTLDDRARYAIVYLLNQNGEAGVTCSAACTDGLARLLRDLGDDARSRRVLQEIETSTPGHWVHGAQFVTEAQGGSDAGANATRARAAQDGLYTLHGRKWFCSNCTADYWAVTARPEGAPEGPRGLGLFCVPRLWEGRANGHRILRLKEKLGTRALPTAEIDLEGAVGWPVGALDQGLRNMVGIVLGTSRVHNTLACAAFVRRAHREARAYTAFRRAFGRPLDRMPLVDAELDALRQAADAMAAGAFGMVDAWADARSRPDDAERTLWARVLVSLGKATAARANRDWVYRAMMLLGGNGIEERFCALPRLWRDAAILETWEGPYTLLLMQALDDLARFGVAGREEAFLRGHLGDFVDASSIARLRRILEAPQEPARICEWAELGPRLYRAFEEHALHHLGA